MEIDENNDINPIKVKTLASFYPSSCIKATKDLEKHGYHFGRSKITDHEMEQEQISDEEKLRIYHQK